MSPRPVLEPMGKAAVLFYRRGCLSICKGASYSGFLAIFPVLTTLATLLVQARATPVLKVLSRFLTGVLPPGTEPLVLERFVSSGQRPVLLLIAATLLAIYAASGVMMSLMEAFDRLYHIPSGRPFLKQRLMAALLVVTSALPAVGASTLILLGARTEQSINRWLRDYPDAEPLTGGLLILGYFVRYSVALATIVLVTGLLYYLGPNRRQNWHSVWPGAWLATVLWLGATSLFALYVRKIGSYNVLYGSIGAVIALLVWMYLLAIIACYGCAFNAVERRR
ncbi:MAG: YihY/virulence factor BrkB family protein [Bryobacterales bacterium]|nr:YihY/virulence factor BrkB family protein [Bryobacterales bacterium]